MGKHQSLLRAFIRLVILAIALGSIEGKKKEDNKKEKNEKNEGSDDDHYDVIVMFQDPGDQESERTFSVGDKLEEWELDGQAVQKYEYKRAIRGLALVELTAAQVDTIRADPDVFSVSPDDEAETLALGGWDAASLGEFVDISSSTSTNDDYGWLGGGMSLTGSVGMRVQENVWNWGLDRLDSDDEATSPTLYDQRYRYSWTGRNVNLYVMDSGVSKSHDDFSGRFPFTITTSTTESSVDGIPCQGFVDGEPCADTYGHGTHVAGLAAGRISGVAKEANLIDVKIINQFNRARYSDIIEALDWILQEQEQSPYRGVVNLSIGGPYNPGLNAAVSAVVNAGIVVVVSAGNMYPTQACDFSPASADGVITVAASNQNDERAWYSNVGDCVDVFAPGTSVLSSNWLDDQTVVYKSGTSMSAPFVAGVAALYLQKNPHWTPAQVLEAIKNDALVGVIQDAQSPNLLVNTARGLLETNADEVVLTATRPTPAPSGIPSLRGSAGPTMVPSMVPTPIAPSHSPSLSSSATPSIMDEPSAVPSLLPRPWHVPSSAMPGPARNTLRPSGSREPPPMIPTVNPSGVLGPPSAVPSRTSQPPSAIPSASRAPSWSVQPSTTPSRSDVPSLVPTTTRLPTLSSGVPSSTGSAPPSDVPSTSSPSPQPVESVTSILVTVPFP